MVDEGLVGLGVAGDVVVLEQVGGSAVDAAVAVPFAGDSLLACGRVTVSTGRVDRKSVRFGDEEADERFGEESGDGMLGDRRPVVQGAAVATDVDNHLGRDGGSALTQESHEGPGALLGE